MSESTSSLLPSDVGSSECIILRESIRRGVSESQGAGVGLLGTLVIGSQASGANRPVSSLTVLSLFGHI